MKILLLGANGQVGNALLPRLTEVGDVIAATRSGGIDGSPGSGVRKLAVDLSDPASLGRTLDEAGADIIVNAAAYTAVDRAEQEPEIADRVNHLAVAEIGAWAKRHGARVMHFSTDYVFAGTADTPYREDDATAPLGAYGRSKLAGEQALQHSECVHLILRTAWVYAPSGHNFLRTMLRLAGERDELRIVDDQIGAPTPAHVIATVTAFVLQRWTTDAQCVRESGVFHLTTRGQCSWFQFATAIFENAHGAELIEKVPGLVPITTADYPTPAQRPAYSVLNCTRLELRYGLQLPTWQAALRQVIDEMKNHTT